MLMPQGEVTTGQAAEDSLWAFSSSTGDTEQAGLPADSIGLEDQQQTADTDFDLISAFADDDEEEVVPPARQQTTETQDTPDVELTAEQILAIQNKYKNNPVEMAKALFNAQRLIGRQGNELGALRQATTPAPIPQDIPAFVDVNTTRTFNPSTDPYDEETGWPVDENGNTFTPLNSVGIEYIPESRLRVIQQELIEKHGTNIIAAQQEYHSIIENHNQKMALAFAEKEAQFLPAQVPVARQVINGIKEELALIMPEGVADVLAKRVLDLAATSVPKAFQNGQLAPESYLHRDMLGNACTSIFKSFTLKQIREAAAEVVRANPELAPKPQQKQQTTQQRKTGTTRQTTSQSMPASNGRTATNEVDYVTPKSFTFDF